MSTPYSLTIANTGSSPAQVAMYSTLPSEGGSAHSIIMFSQQIDASDSHTYTWNLNWELGWGTSIVPLTNGVSFTSQGNPINVSPHKGDQNGISITYDGDFSSAGTTSSKLEDTHLKITTDDSFTKTDSAKMSVCAYLSDKPIFAMQGEPNGVYDLTTHPTYYLAVTDQKEGIAVSGTFISNAQKIEFDGVFDLSCSLNDRNEFACPPAGSVNHDAFDL
jgi:hypothetical protein